MDNSVWERLVASALAEAEGWRESRARAEAIVERLCALPKERRRLWLVNAPQHRTPMMVEAIVERIRGLRRNDPSQALDWTELAVEIAATIQGPLAEDARILAQAEHGNVLRILGRFPEASHELSGAFGKLSLGSGDPMLEAMLCSYFASLRRSERKFDEASTFLDRAGDLHQEIGDSLHSARNLTSRFLLEQRRGCPDEAFEAAWQAVLILPHDAEPALRSCVLHNLVAAIAEKEPEKALPLLRRVRYVVEADGGVMERFRLIWLEGRLLSEVGGSRHALEKLLQARDGFVNQELAFEAALVNLDVSLFHLRNQDRSAAANSAVEALTLLESRGIQADKLGALRMFSLAIECERNAVAKLVPFLTRLRNTLRQNVPELVS